VSWKVSAPLKKRVPCPVELLRFLFVGGLVNALILDAPKAGQWFSFSVALLVGFHGLLKPGELVGVTRRCLTLPRQLAFAAVDAAVLAILDPKTKFHLGRAQFTVIRHAITIAWLRWLATDLGGKQKIFLLTTTSFRRLFRHVCSQLHISSCGLTPSSLRAGGATFLFQEGHLIDRIRFLGRWRSLATLERYIQEAAATLVLAQLPHKAERTLHQLDGIFPYLPYPPVLPWQAFFSRGAQLRALDRFVSDTDAASSKEG